MFVQFMTYIGVYFRLQKLNNSNNLHHFDRTLEAIKCMNDEYW